MPVLPRPSQPSHSLPGAVFTSLATPSLGTRENSAWMVELAPKRPSTPHSLTREELFFILSGEAEGSLDGEPFRVSEGDVLVVPRETPFSIVASGDSPLKALCCFPVGGQARLTDGQTFTPPWAE